MTSARSIAHALGGAIEGSDGWWNCKCPAHEDGKASLGLHDTDDGALAWRCMAGCEKAAVAAALKARGLLPARPKKDKGGGRIVATYAYRDEQGALLFEVCRFQPKDFRQRRPDPAGRDGWVWRLGSTRRVLYRLPELLAADPAEPVFVTEGEKDADRLRSLGLVATTNPQGAGKWLKADRAALAGRHVVVLPDHDDAGRKHATQIVRDLTGKAASVRVLSLPGLPEKGDVSDWFAAGGTVEKLRRMATEAGVEDGGWLAKLVLTEKGTPRDCLANGAIVLRQDPAFARRIRFDEHRQAIIGRDMPWRLGSDWRDWTDTDDLCFAEWCQLHEVPLSPRNAAHAVAVVANDHRVHPIREYLDGLKWDGVPRLNTWLTTYLGVSVPKDEAETKGVYVREVGRRWPIAAVARIYKPGCKVDTVPILEGPQGALKSSVLAALVPNPAWFSDQISDLGSKDASQDLNGKWLIELAELSAMRRSETERIKAFVSRASDWYRPSYAHRPQDFPRQCVFAGTTNADTYFGDATGSRRFWPVRVGKIDLDGLRAAVPQLWAEAVAAFKAGEKWWLDPALEKIAAEEQAARREADTWEPAVLDWAARQTAAPTTADVLAKALGIEPRHQKRADAMRVGAIFKANAWERYRTTGPNRPWAYRPCPTSPPGGTEGGTEKAADSAACPTVPPVPLGGSTQSNGHDSTAEVQHDSQHAVLEESGDTSGTRQDGGTTRAAPGFFGQNPGGTRWDGAGHAGGTDAPSWTNLDEWRARYRHARDRDERINVALEWGRAAGGTVQDGEALALKLPPDLPNCLALAELRRVARDLKVLAP